MFIYNGTTGWGDSLGGKGLVVQAWEPVFDLQNLHEIF